MYNFRSFLVKVPGKKEEEIGLQEGSSYPATSELHFVTNNERKLLHDHTPFTFN
jgi:hypothetical protein